MEPRISGVKANQMVSKLEFSNSFRVEAEGFSGGIWILWEGNKVSIDIISSSTQCIHSTVSFNGGKENFILTCVYGSSIPSVRQDLWKQLEVFSKSVGNLKCLCIGDFNTYKAVEDKQGGAKPNSKSTFDFTSLRNNCNLMDLNFVGPRFTWKNGKIQERIDWVLANFSWFTYFKEAYSKYLNWLKSDHMPILLKLGGNDFEFKTQRRFRFVAAWTTEASFKELVKISWCKNSDWPYAITDITKNSDWPYAIT